MSDTCVVLNQVATQLFDAQGNEIRFPRVTPYDEQVTTHFTTIFSLHPNWGVSRLRDRVEELGTASVAETNGEIKVTAGTGSAGVGTLKTVERGQYLAGSSALVGMGARVDPKPTDSQELTWGYIDEDNGFYFGEDATGVFIARSKAGTETKTYQTNWNVDPLDGSGPSGLTLDTQSGNIFQILFNWYGYGTIEFQIVLADSLGVQRSFAVHRINVSNEISIIDPNQPIRFRSDNGGSSSATESAVYVGGRQFSVGRPDAKQAQRQVTETVSGYDLQVSRGTFEPIIAARPKSVFNGRPNSVSQRVTRWNILTDHSVEIKVEYDASVTGASWATATDWDTNETATEFAKTSFSSSGGLPVFRDFIDATVQSGVQQKTVAANYAFDGDGIIVVYVKPMTAFKTEVSAALTVTEDW